MRKRRLKPIFKWPSLGLAILMLGWLIAPKNERATVDNEPQVVTSSMAPILEAPAPQPAKPVKSFTSGPMDQPIFNILREQGFTAQDVHRLNETFKGHFNFRKARPDHKWSIEWLDDQPQNFGLQVSRTQKFECNLAQDEWHVTEFETPTSKQTELFQVTLDSNLYEAFSLAPQGNVLAIKLAEVFRWDIDFYQDPRSGDQIQVLVETEYIEEDNNWTFLSYGKILAATYEGQRQTYQAFWFDSDKTEEGYFDQKGQSLRRAILRSPLKFERVTSRFQKNRFHPVLKKNRPHNGVDYGAARNTPVMAVANGKVIKSGRYGGAGKMIEIKHQNGMVTQYMHLNGFAKGIRRGAKVKQGQTIGFVGKTGLATGYHLHYGMKINGRYVDPLKQKVRPGKPIGSKELPNFALQMRHYETAIDAILMNRRVMDLAKLQ